MRSKNSKLSSPLISKPAGNPFFKNALKVLMVIALLQVGAVLFFFAPRFMTTAVKLLPQKTSLAVESSVYPFSGVDGREVRPSAERPRSSAEGQLPTEKPASEVNGYNSVLLPLPKKTISASSRSEESKSRRETIIKAGASLLEGANNVQPGASLGIIDIRHTHGSLGEQALKIAIKSLSQESISIPDVKVQVYFYDQQGGEIVASKAPVTSRWLRSPVEWKDGEPEILEVVYQPESVSSELYYVGYIVAVYYKGELQSYRADPVKLTSQFPIKVFIGPNEL